MLNLLQKAGLDVRAGQFNDVRRIDLDSLIREAQESIDAYYEVMKSIDFSCLAYKGDKTTEEIVHTDETPNVERGLTNEANIEELEWRQPRHSARNLERELELQARGEAERNARLPAYQAGEVVDQVRQLVSRLGMLRNSELHVLGTAGFGKTHLACNICLTRVQAGLPAILILGRQVTGDLPLREQLLRILDIPRVYEWSDFIEALTVAAKVRNTRIPIVIDGLNEATRNGRFSSIWRDELAGFVSELKQLEDVVLITTCRESYRDYIWEVNTPQLFITAHGFESESEVEEAVQKYFGAYKISADLTISPLNQFRHPIYLKLFCEAINHARMETRHVYLGEQMLYTIFDKFIAQCNSSIASRLHLPPRIDYLRPCLNRIARYLWEKRQRGIPISVAIELIDRKPPIEIDDWDRSLTNAVESEGLLVFRDRNDSGEFLFFTYDLIGGYIIACYLVDTYRHNFAGFINTDETQKALYSNTRQLRHPLQEDIRRCLAALLPKEFGQYLHELTDNERAFADSVNSFFEIDPNYVNQVAVEVMASLFKIANNRKRLFYLAESTWAYPDHPLGAQFWHENLVALSMVEQDLAWTEYVRSNLEDAERTVELLVKRSRNDSPLSEVEESRLKAIAMRTMWLLTSTSRPLRDKATEALYWYGRRLPTSFFHLLQLSLAVNDIYVPERMLAVAYGIAMARHIDFSDQTFTQEQLPSWARFIYLSMFSTEAPYSTTHILMRDYARYIIDIARIHFPNVLTDEEIARTLPPYKDGGIRNWGKSEPLEQAGQHPKPVQMDFENYTLGRLVRDRANYDFKHPKYVDVHAKFFWRLYDLGYTFEQFGEVDREIERIQGWRRQNDTNKTDRYGKKYSWIAYFELAGFLRDQSDLRDQANLDESELRSSFVDIDPSFPDESPAYLLVVDDWLGTVDVDTADWIVAAETPNIYPYLLVESLQEEYGPWVLLDAFIQQEDQLRGRTITCTIRPLLVHADNSNHLIETIQQYGFGEWDIHSFDVPYSYYTFAGEIPWGTTFSKNEITEITHVLNTETRMEDSEVFELLSDGEALEDKAYQQFKLEAILAGALASTRDIIDRDKLSEMASKRGLGLEIKVEPQEVVYKNTVKNYLFIPVRECRWESYHSVANPGYSATYLARQLTEYLNLVGQPQSFDLYEQDGRRASVLVSINNTDDSILKYQDMLFVRQELLEKILEGSGTQLLWAIWGDHRRAWNPDVLERSPNRSSADEIRHKEYRTIKRYEGG